MVFPKILYCRRRPFCGAAGIAPDLVAPTNLLGMEDRPHNSDTCSQLDFVPNHNGIHSYTQGVLQAT